MITDIGQLLPIAPIWDELSRFKPYQCFAWQRAWLETLGRNLKVRVLVARYGETVVGILPLVQRTRTLTGTTLEFIGSVPDRTSDMGILVKPSHEQRVSVAFAEYLLNDCPFPFSQLELTGISEDDPGMHEFADQIRMRTNIGFESVREADSWLFKIQVSPDGTHIWPMCLRKASYAAREAFQSGTFTYSPGISDLASSVSLESENLLVLGKLNHLEPQAVEDKPESEGDAVYFLNHFADLLQEEPSANRALSSRLCVPILRWQSKPIAGAVAIVNAGTMHIYRIDVDKNQPAQTSLWLLHWAMVQDAARRGIRCMVYGAELQQQIQDIRCTAAPVHHWKVTMPGLSSRVRKAVMESTIGLRFGARGRASRPFSFGPLSNSQP